jgi:hypothetical protein
MRTNKRNEWGREYIALKWTGIRMERSGEKERVWQWKRMMVNKRMERMNEKERERVSLLGMHRKERVSLCEWTREMNEKENALP